MDTATREDGRTADTDSGSSRRIPSRLLLVLGLLLVTAVLITLGGEAALIKGAMDVGDDAPQSNEDLVNLKEAVDAAETPLNWALWTVVPLGVVAGGGMLAMGSKRGVTVMATSVAAGCAVGLGKGLIA